MPKDREAQPTPLADRVAGDEGSSAADPPARSQEEPDDIPTEEPRSSAAGLASRLTRPPRSMVSDAERSSPEGEASEAAKQTRRKPPPSDAGSLPDDPSFRYEDLGLIGRGAMGEVRRVRDRDLNREVAMKIVRGSLMKQRRLLTRFIAEAQATAQLTHPNIVPIHELGVLPDGRFFFTMKAVKGKTLREVIASLHHPSPSDERSPRTWTLRRVMDLFKKVCDAVAYAHSRGVVHRDLKPDNIMVGGFGEVLVLDWGLAKVLRRALDLDASGTRPVVTNRSNDKALQTMVGTVAGTPSYMPPEQAMGKFSELQPTADVYALGAMLYEILVGRPPYTADDAEQVIGKVLAGPPTHALPSSYDWGGMSKVDLSESGEGPSIPRDLARIAKRAMRRDPDDRFPHAGDIAGRITDWLEGSQKREQARAKVAEAAELIPEVNRLRKRAGKLRKRAKRILVGVPAHAAARDKLPAWQLQEQADKAEREAAINEIQSVQLLQGAITMAPDLDEAHDLLADYYRERHERAERLQLAALSARYEAMLQAHDTGRHSEYLDGRGRLTLVTSESEAEVVLMRYLERSRIQVPVSPKLVGRTPVVGGRIPFGSSLIVIRKDGFQDVRFPIRIGRLEHWDGLAPGGYEAHPIHLPREGELEDDDCYVPAGWFVAGGEADTPGAMSRRKVWLDGFVLKRFPITVGEYITFLNDLVARGRERDALQHAPRLRRTSDGPEEMILVRDRDGRFTVSDRVPETRHWRPDWPITCIDWFGADAYGTWYAERTGLPWRLPMELEWEKAARGVDARTHPWGDFFDPSFCNMKDSHAGEGEPDTVDSYPVDASPYRVRGLAGNVKEFCMDVFRSVGPEIDPDGRALLCRPRPSEREMPRSERGGSWLSSARSCRAAARNRVSPYRRSPTRGFRLARAIGGSKLEER